MTWIYIGKDPKLGVYIYVKKQGNEMYVYHKKNWKSSTIYQGKLKDVLKTGGYSVEILKKLSNIAYRHTQHR